MDYVVSLLTRLAAQCLLHAKVSSEMLLDAPQLVGPTDSLSSSLSVSKLGISYSAQSSKYVCCLCTQAKATVRLTGLPCLQERQKLLTFVVVGGGPTGVEVAAELYDLVRDDLRRFYPEIWKDSRVCLVELQDHVLSTYDRKISDYTSQLFSRQDTLKIRYDHLQRVVH